MQFRLSFILAVLFVLGSISTANAQCQLATSEEQDTGPDYSGLDLSVLDAIDPLSAEISELPPYDLDLLGQRAYEAHTTGEIELAAKIYLYILNFRRDNRVFYNLACAYGLMNEPELTAKYLEKAFLYGYDNFDWLYQDTDFDRVRSTPVVADVIDSWAQIVADRSQQGGENVYTPFPAIQKYNIQLPEGYDAEKVYPLVIGLHGAYGSADNFSRLYMSFENPQFIYVAVQAPYRVGVEQPSYVWFGGMPYEDEVAAAESRELNTGYLINVMDNVKEQYKVDGVYLIGFSQGGMTACHAEISNPELFDGAICFGGSLVTDWATDDLLAGAGGARLFIAQGDADNIEHAYLTRDMLEEAGCDVTFREFGGGHYINLEALLEAQEWMQN